MIRKESILKSKSSISWPFTRTSILSSAKRTKSEKHKKHLRRNIKQAHESFKEYHEKLLLERNLRNKIESLQVFMVTDVSSSSDLIGHGNISHAISTGQNKNPSQSAAGNNHPAQEGKDENAKYDTRSEVNERIVALPVENDKNKIRSLVFQKELTNFLKTRATKNRKSKKSNLSTSRKGKQRKPLISFFDDSTIEDSSPSAGVQLPGRVSLISSISSEGSKSSLNMDIMSKYRTYKSLRTNWEKEYNIQSSGEDESLFSLFKKANILMETPRESTENHQIFDDLHEELLSLEDETKEYGSRENENVKGTSVEKFWSRTDVHYKLIAKEYSSLPPSRKVFENFVHSTTKNLRDTKEACGSAPVKESSARMLMSIDHSDNNTSSTTSISPKTPHLTLDSEKMLTDIEISPTDRFSSENINLIKLAILKEMSKRPNNEHQNDAEFSEYFTKLVRNQISIILSELLECHINTKMVQENDIPTNVSDVLGKFNMNTTMVQKHNIPTQLSDVFESTVRPDISESKIQHYVEHIKKEKVQKTQRKPKKYTRNLLRFLPKATSTKTMEESEDIIDYNRALNEFKRNLLESDSEGTISKEKVHKKTPTAPTSSKSDRGKESRKDNRSRVSSQSRDEKLKAMDSFLKNRKQEVENKLKKYSKKKTRSLEKKKPLSETDGINEIAHLNPKHQGRTKSGSEPNDTKQKTTEETQEIRRERGRKYKENVTGDSQPSPEHKEELKTRRDILKQKPKEKIHQKELLKKDSPILRKNRKYKEKATSKSQSPENFQKDVLKARRDEILKIKQKTEKMLSPRKNK